MSGGGTGAGGRRLLCEQGSGEPTAPVHGAGACAGCLRRAWLVAALASHVAAAVHRRGRLVELLALRDAELIAALGGARRKRIERAYARFDARDAHEACEVARVTPVCQHDRRYPAALDGADRPAVLYVAGDPERFAALAGADPVAIVGARRASPYGLDVARSLARDLAVAGVTTISGMALGADAAAHEGALAGGGQTIAVLANGADRAYPASKRGLYERICAQGAVVSELPPGCGPWRWTFPARNRIIAALGGVTVVVEAAERSGSLITAELAAELGREVGAVPGRVTSPLAVGTNRLIADGAHVVRDARDVLDLLFGAGARGPASGAELHGAEPGKNAERASVMGLRAELREVLEAVECGHDTVDGLSCDGAVARPLDAGELMAALGELELLGLVRRDLGGRYRRALG